MGLLFGGKRKVTGKLNLNRDLLTRPVSKEALREFQKKNPYTKI